MRDWLTFWHRFNLRTEVISRQIFGIRGGLLHSQGRDLLQGNPRGETLGERSEGQQPNIKGDELDRAFRYNFHIYNNETISKIRILQD